MDTIPYRGVLLEGIVLADGQMAVRWRCGRCGRLGRGQSRGKAEAGKARHKAMHAAQDRAAAAREQAARCAAAFGGEHMA